MRDESLENRVLSALDQAHDGKTFSASLFYQYWFPKRQSYLFLFKKNLRVTNIPHAELIALLRAYISINLKPKPACGLQFTSSREFKSSLDSLVTSFPITQENRIDDLTRLARLYAPILCGTVVLDSFFGSCVVSLPSHMTLALESVCGKSGYVHSCGQLILARNMAKATKDEFFSSLRQYLEQAATEGQHKKHFFAVYAHEDFTSYDRDKAAELRNGLDEVKLFVEKCFMGNERLVAIARKMRETFNERLEIPDPGDFREKHEPALRGKSIDRDRTLWLIVDQSVNESNLRHPGDESFLICYEQRYINQNLWHVFDENKPAWAAHTTIPHTLAGAMISISKPFWPEKGPVVIGDPFCGSGTICLEARKYPRTEVVGGDIDPLCTQLLTDNINYVQPDPKRLAAFIKMLGQFCSGAERRKLLKPAYFYALNRHMRIIRLAVSYHNHDHSGDTNARKATLKTLSQLSLKQRLVFYIGLRAIRRHAAALEREAEVWHEAFEMEARQLRQEFVRVLHLAKLRPLKSNSSQPLAQGMYSQSCLLDHDCAYSSGDGKLLCKQGCETGTQLVSIAYGVFWGYRGLSCQELHASHRAVWCITS